MQLPEAISVIQKGIIPHSSPQTWADLGVGKGLFSEALFSILQPGSIIHAVDLHKQPNLQHHPSIIFHQANFVKDKLPIPTLDGILMANSLHYVQEQVAISVFWGIKRVIDVSITVAYIKQSTHFL
jgi:hypothetical protein